MTLRHYRLTELDAAQRFARRLRETASKPVRVIRGQRGVVVRVVEDERRVATPRHPDRRAGTDRPQP